MNKQIKNLTVSQVISQYCRIHHDKKPFSHVAMDLFREVIIGKADARENKLPASRQPKNQDEISPTADSLRVKKYSTVTRPQSEATNQNMRLDYLLNKQMCNQNEVAHEPLPIGQLNTMNKLTNHFYIIGSSLPGLLILK